MGGPLGSMKADDAIQIWRALWGVAFLQELPLEYSRSLYRPLDLRRLVSVCGVDDSFLQLVMARLGATSPQLASVDPSGTMLFHLFALKPMVFLRRIFENVREEADLRYSLRRNIRTIYGCSYSSATARDFRVLVDALNECLTEERIAGRELQKDESPAIWHYSNDLVPCLQAALQESDGTENRHDSSIHAFIETCLMVGYFEAHDKLGCVRFLAHELETEFLLSHLFGLPTSIRGFDTLFGGGGLILPEHSMDSSLPARMVLIRGRFGAGKTLLSLQLAVEVAKKGGISWISPLEQGAADYLYALESMGLNRECQVMVVTSPVEAAQKIDLLRKLPPQQSIPYPTNSAGILVILDSPRSSLDEFLATLEETSAYLEGFSLRLLVADPINSVVPGKDAQATEVRRLTVDRLNKIKSAGTNVLVVAEESEAHTDEFIDEAYIADVVIRLSIHERHRYRQRYFEICKSRLQREQRGEHAFSIQSGAGIRIFPSSAAVNARIAGRRSNSSQKPRVKFGLASVDEMLGHSAILDGDVLVLQGPSGTNKTRLGLAFLLGTGGARDPVSSGNLGRSRPTPCALVVAAVDDAANIRRLLAEPSFDDCQRTSRLKGAGDIQICSLQTGFVNPGYVFQKLEDAFDLVRTKGLRVDRLMFDNLAHVELVSPFISEDVIFGDTLVRFLRRQGVTSLLVCDDSAGENGSILQRSIADGADTVIRLERPMFKGIQRVMVRVLKTRGIEYRNDLSELVVTRRGLEIQPGSPLLRFGRDGEAKPVPICLLLHSESEMQSKYNEDLKRALQSTLSAARIEPIERIFTGHAARLSAYSGIDELQVWQVDEFQVPEPSGHHDQEVALISMAPDSFGDEHDRTQFIDRLARRVEKHPKVLPFYVNIGLLAYRVSDKDGVTSKTVASWKEIAKACRKWEKQNPGDLLFFDFPKNSSENYNCLFLEILLSLGRVPQTATGCGLLSWLGSARARQACNIFWRLARRAYRNFKQRGPLFRPTENSDFKLEATPSDESTNLRVRVDALVWRHWYSTLNQMFADIEHSEERAKVKVCMLPGGIAIAGEWYLGIPSYSAAPAVGTEIIKFLTTRQAEMARLNQGIGLPTRKGFYKTEQSDSHKSLVSPHFSMNVKELGDLVENAFSRSQFGCYSSFSEVLSYHLQKILEIDDETNLKVRIEEVLTDLQARLNFLSGPHACQNCPAKGGTATQLR